MALSHSSFITLNLASSLNILVENKFIYLSAIPKNAKLLLQMINYVSHLCLLSVTFFNQHILTDLLEKFYIDAILLMQRRLE